MEGDASDKTKMDTTVDLLLAGKLPKAREVADTIVDLDYREWMLGDLVKNMVGAGAVDSAIAVAQFMSISYYKADAFRSIAKYLVARGDVQGALSALEKANRVPLEVVIPGPLDSDIASDKAEALYEISKQLFAAGDHERAEPLRSEAIQVAQSGQSSPNIQHSLDASKVLSFISRDLAASGDMAAATTVAESITHPVVQGDALEMLAEMKGESVETQ